MTKKNDRMKYLHLLAKQFPNVRAASSEIIHLQAILSLPKGTEHFMSDLHGEADAFVHILNNASGAVREKVDIVLGDTLPAAECASIATLIYYPEEKLEQLVGQTTNPKEWYRITIMRLLDICRLCASKYTTAKVRRALPQWNGELMAELLTQSSEYNKRGYYESLITSIIENDMAEDFIISMCGLIKRLVVDHLHIVGDIYDRGPRPDIIMDMLMAHHSVDIQWGNHDVLWMGAATGSRTCVATVLSNSINYNNLEMIETGYGISLRPLMLFADEVYSNCDITCFKPKKSAMETASATDIERAGRMHKAIAMIQFKLEGQKFMRNPSFNMQDRLLLDKIDYEKKTVKLPQGEYPLRDCDFPTVDPKDPYKLTPAEEEVIDTLKNAFLHSEKLQRHIRFLYTKGSLYKVHNGNLLFHGCVPMDENGEFLSFEFDGKKYAGKALMDHCEIVARQGYYAKEGTLKRQFGQDFLWFLWAGRHAPSYGRRQMTTFERRLIEDESTWKEPKNAYYDYYNTEETCVRVLKEFGLEGKNCHIINGHVPVKTKKGESPIKGDGRLIVIDGGFCRAYQSTTGIAGYTLVFDSWGIHLSSHEPFPGREEAIRDNIDILSTEFAFDHTSSRIRIRDTDLGAQLQQDIDDLKDLVKAFRSGEITEVDPAREME